MVECEASEDVERVLKTALPNVKRTRGGGMTDKRFRLNITVRGVEVTTEAPYTGHPRFVRIVLHWPDTFRIP